ncbi:MAG: hypothetical protein Q8L34_02090 [Candidatus Woesearchaeota archaeon]|nr:hypothetical protein [Candidatus Woesearchaeota archaeon]
MTITTDDEDDLRLEESILCSIGLKLIPENQAPLPLEAITIEPLYNPHNPVLPVEYQPKRYT